MALDIVRGVLHMHDLGIVHQDIKSGNVMLSKDFTAKIGDVGLAAVFSHSHSRSDTAHRTSSNPGTLEWCAPEVGAMAPCQHSHLLQLTSLSRFYTLAHC